ncbi:diaminopimelate epimerase [Tomitella gaofuii]|uniref:diaminopimelate epimerase n=1 Tax=Tomitella gaofuii TaxID=2760083 RepID=UPI0015FD3D87|nr:diaminopimelate epimerase [Tomitella gaofuii]
MDFVKGHGTENDFLVLPDDDARIDLAPAAVAALCDRRRGLGADGVLRVARAGALRAAGVLAPGLPEGVGEHDWFMDYRNADGSAAEMCGNGVRVFAHYLCASGREQRDAFVVGTRAGARAVTMAGPRDFAAQARVSVEMGPVTGFGDSSVVLGGAGGTTLPGVAVDVGNPHLVSVVAGLDDAGLAELDIASAPAFDAALFPDGVNVEVVTPLRAGAVAMRVHERGVGETRSCGTGTVAAAFAALRAENVSAGTVEVGVPGGAVTVTIGVDGRAVLEGPSVLVASGAVDDRWWRDAENAARPVGAGAA